MEQTRPLAGSQASTTRRFFNLLIDSVVYLAVMLLLVSPLLRLVFGNAFFSNFWFTYGFNLVMLYAYYFLFEDLLQRTPGKIVTGTRVVALDGLQAGTAQIALRTLIRFLPLEAFSLFTGKDPQRKRTWWHDRWVTTRVVRI